MLDSIPLSVASRTLPIACAELFTFFCYKWVKVALFEEANSEFEISMRHLDCNWDHIFDEFQLKTSPLLFSPMGLFILCQENQ